jgi:hypothetical protein
MKALMWKEWRENVKWVPLPTLVIGGLMAVLAPPSLMDNGSLMIFALVDGLFGVMLGFLQVSAEAQGDKRSLLLHRPLSRSHIFLAKASVGVGLYLLALGIPFAIEVGLAATPGHIAEPFRWPMTLPWLADVLTGLVYYFAGMLTAQREARWYASRCLGVAAGLFCSVLVWTLPQFWQVLLAILLVGGLVAVAAWGSFLTGGAYAPQPRPAKIALALTLLMGLSVLSFTAKVFLGGWTWSRAQYYYGIDHQGRILLIHEEQGKLQSITDLEGQVPPLLLGERLDYYTLKETVAPWAWGGWTKTRSYRNTKEMLVKYANETKPGSEDWWYVPAQGRLLGYDKHSKLLIGSFGPDGFAAPDEQPRAQFEGEIYHVTHYAYLSLASPYLAFPGGVYTVDFRKRTVRTLFVPTAGETVLWASRWEDEKQKQSLAFVGTDQAIHVLDSAGTRLLSAPLAFDRATYRIHHVGKLENPRRYWIWYEPAWHLGLGRLETMPGYVAEYDIAGQEIAPRTIVPALPGGAREFTPPVPLGEPSSAHIWFGLITAPAEAAVLMGTMNALQSEVRENNGSEMSLLLPFLFTLSQFFLPGVRWLPSAHPGLVFGNTALMLLAAGVSAVICLVLTRRYAFSRLRCLGWTLWGLLWGPVGLLLLLTLQEWPARIVCPKCSKLRVVTRDRCEHCGAPHALPPMDGTEIFESISGSAHTALAEH